MMRMMTETIAVITGYHDDDGDDWNNCTAAMFSFVSKTYIAAVPPNVSIKIAPHCHLYLYLYMCIWIFVFVHCGSATKCEH